MLLVGWQEGHMKILTLKMFYLLWLINTTEPINTIRHTVSYDKNGLHHSIINEDIRKNILVHIGEHGIHLYDVNTCSLEQCTVCHSHESVAVPSHAKPPVQTKQTL